MIKGVRSEVRGQVLICFVSESFHLNIFGYCKFNFSNFLVFSPCLLSFAISLEQIFIYFSYFFLIEDGEVEGPFGVKMVRF